MTVFRVAAEVLREAVRRRWVLALVIGVTLVLGVVASALRLEVIDGALAATRLFGNDVDNEIRAVDVALRPVFRASAYVVFYGGLVFGIVASADFGPSLLQPGRIEHLLAQPLRRWHLLAGTYLGVFVLATLAALYGAGGFAVILGFKTGVWTVGPLVAALLASAAFASIFGLMLATATFVRSPAMAAVAGGLAFVAGVVASYRPTLAEAFEGGVGRTIFELVTLPVPRVASLAEYAGDLAAAASVDGGALLRVLGGVLLCGLGALALGIWHFESRDF
jgi:Cu-processing system permease protein